MKSLRHKILTLPLILALAACSSGGDSAAPSPIPAEPAASDPVPARPSETRDERAASYAGVVSLALQDLGLPADIEASKITVTEGQAPSLTVKDGFVRFLTPADTGADTKVVLKAELAGKDVLIPVVARSERPTAVEAVTGPSEDGSPNPEPLPLSVTGLGAGNALTGGALTFSVKGAPPLNAFASGVTAYSPSTNKVYDLAKHWALDPSTNAFVISQQSMQKLLAELPGGELELQVGLGTEDGAFAQAYSLNAFKPEAQLQGRIVNLQGQVVTSFAGRLLAVRGQGNPVRTVVTVNADGTFTVPNLPVGTYQVAVLDAQAPNVWVAVVPIFAGSKVVTLDMVVNVSDSGTAMKALAGGSPGAAVQFHDTVKQDGQPPVSRGAQEQEAVNGFEPRNRALAVTTNGCSSTVAGSASFQVSGQAQKESVKCEVKYTIPQGTTKVGVRTEVATQEYPWFSTKENNVYNDIWSYALVGLPNFEGDSGVVNKSHFSSGRLVKNVCIDVSAAAATKDLPVSGVLMSANVGDNMLPTTVTTTISLTCDRGFRVTSADIGTGPNVKGWQVVKPMGRAGSFMSIPVGQAPAEWGFALDVKYEPADADITAAQVGLSYGGQVIYATGDVLAQATQKAPGRLVFANLLLPPFNVQRFSGQFSFVVKLSGSVSGQAAATNPLMDNPATVGGAATSITAMFSAADYTPASRRYGARDPGGDSWAASSTIDWLMSNSYIYDDVSALHIAQFSKSGVCWNDPANARKAGDSAMCHIGHSDGQQVDLRYLPGAGNPETMDGRGTAGPILAVLTAAASEVASGAPQQPNVAKAAAWVSANRLLAEREAGKASNLIMGPKLQEAMLLGQLPGGAKIPGITPWTTKPAVVKFSKPHDHHWHISLLPVRQ